MNPICMSCLRGLDSRSVEDDIGSFHEKCARSLFGQRLLPKLALTRRDLLSPESASRHLKRMSISGVQPKISLKLIDSGRILAATDTGGVFMLKPSPEQYEEAAQAEILGLVTASLGGIAIPPAGMVRLADGTYAYLIRRFDRSLTGERILRVEDMAQVMSIRRDAAGEFKYASSYEDVILAARMATGGRLAVSAELFCRLVQSYLVANGDLHIKNMSLVAPKGHLSHMLTGVSPAYDILSTSIWLRTEKPIALSLLREENEGRGTPSFDALGFHSRADFHELAKRLEIGSRFVETVIHKHVRAVREGVKLSALSGLLSESKQHALEQETDDRIQKIENPGIATFKI